MVDFCLRFSPNPHFFLYWPHRRWGYVFFNMSALTPNNLVMGVSRFFPYHYTPKTENIRKLVSLNPGLLELFSNRAMAPFGRDKLRHRKHLFPTIRDVLKNMEKFFLLLFFQLLNIGSSVCFFAKHGIGEKKNFSNENFFHLRKQNFKSVTKSFGKNLLRVRSEAQISKRCLD